MSKPIQTKAEVIQRLLSMNILKVIDDYDFVSSNMKELLSLSGMKNIEMANELKMEKTKFGRRITNPDLWEIKKIRAACLIIEKTLNEKALKRDK
ncbi:MAG: hypothetical protein HOP30_10160 [Cyclobacteriaceae bacterium]|nr:hypothetical protein [Cyclobacteriaceae bacterium]